jgi:hypothetical protein
MTMGRMARQIFDVTAGRHLGGRLALLVLAPVAAMAGAPSASSTARRMRERPLSPGSCGEFCAPATPCHGGCGCSTGTNCFVCNGCGDVNVLKCFSHTCASGFCWKPVC